MPKTILAVAPDARDMQVITAALGRRYRVWQAPTRNKALGILTGGIRPQLIICPVELDEGDALSFQQEVNRLSTAKRVPYILYGTRESYALFPHALKAATRLLRHPFGEGALQALVDELIGRPPPF